MDIGNEGKHFYVVSGDEWTLGQQQKPLDTWTVVPMLAECTWIVCTSWTLGQYYDIKQLGQRPILDVTGIKLVNNKLSNGFIT